MPKLDDLKYIDRMIDESLKSTSTDAFHLDKAILFAIETFNGETPMTIPIGMNADIYDMLEDHDMARELSPYTKFGIVTCGWASPIKDGHDEDNALRPSEHPLKRRVRLFTMLHGTDFLSSIRFEDDPEVIYDEDKSSGDLKDAMLNFFMMSRLYKGLSSELND